MKVCFVVSQLFAWGKYGGFGSLTRTIGSELAKNGIDVYAVIPRRKGQKPVEALDGITVFGFPPAYLLGSKKYYKKTNADVFHSEEPSIGTYMAQKAMPNRRHLITAQDPRNKKDWKIEHSYLSFKRKLTYPAMYLYETNFLVKKAIKKSDFVYCQAKYITSKVRDMYNLNYDPQFLPNPVELPDRKILKSDKPTVCFLARLDKRKRPEIFLNLAKDFPDVNFITMGPSHDKKWDQYLREKYSGIPNLQMPGFVSSEEKSKILEKSWIMINTAARECLPVAFLEAAAHKCAILSYNNPDDFAKNFGYHAEKDDYANGLRFLLEDNRWRERGERGYEYVKENHELDKVIEQHISVYEKITSDR